MLDFNRGRFYSDIILLSARWYLSYPLSYRNIEEVMRERDIEVDHTSVNRWVLKYTPDINKNLENISMWFERASEWMKPILKLKGNWKYLYRAVDENGETDDFLLTAKRVAMLRKEQSDYRPLFVKN